MKPYEKVAVLKFKTAEDLQNQISALHSTSVVAIIPQEYEFRDMKTIQVLISVLVIYY